MDKGVVILALKKQHYACSAFNLAISIRFYNPNIKIALLTDNTHLQCFLPVHFSVFDWIKVVNSEDYTDIYGFSPAKAKLSIDKYTMYDKTLYIDADSICLRDIEPLFNSLSGNSFKSCIIPDYTQWVDEKDFKDFFGVDQGFTINSSWYYFLLSSK